MMEEKNGLQSEGNSEIVCGITGREIARRHGSYTYVNEKCLVMPLISIKGGVGKTHIAILLARYMARAGLSVLMIDSDLNDSLSNWFFKQSKEKREATRKLNLREALGDESNNLCDYVIPTDIAGIDLIASSAYLSDLRTVSEKRLKRMIRTLDGKYDICIIDCHPTYDNIVLNALHAADYAITPVLNDGFSYNAAVFLSKVIPRDVEGFKNWFILLNGYDKRHEGAKSGNARDFADNYEKSGMPIAPRETWLPWTPMIRFFIDGNKLVTRKKGIKGAIEHSGIYDAIAELADGFFDNLKRPEVF